MLLFTPRFYRADKKKILAMCMIAWVWISLTSCSYSPNYSKVDASNHSVTNYHYSARQMAVGIPNQVGDSMVSTTTEEDENTSQENTARQPTAYPTTRFERPPSTPSSPRNYDTSYIVPNPFTAIFGIFANAFKNFNDRMEYLATHPYSSSSTYYPTQYSQNGYASTYQQSLRNCGVYGPQNSLESQAYAQTAQALNRNRY